MASKQWMQFCKMVRGGKETRSRLRRTRGRNNVKQPMEVKK